MREVEVTLTVDDLIAFAQHDAVSRGTAARGSPWRWAWVLLVFALVSFLALGSGMEGKPWLRLIPVWLGLLLALAFVLWLLHPRLAMSAIRRGIKQSVERGDLDKALRPQLLQITPERLTQSSDDALSTNLWPAIEKIDVTEDHAFFYLTPMAAIVLPKRCFSDEHAFHDFVETARGYHRAATGG